MMFIGDDVHWRRRVSSAAGLRDSIRGSTREILRPTSLAPLFVDYVVHPPSSIASSTSFFADCVVRLFLHGLRRPSSIVDYVVARSLFHARRLLVHFLPGSNILFFLASDSLRKGMIYRDLRRIWMKKYIRFVRGLSHMVYLPTVSVRS
jgi:hypothetical protein